MKKFIALGSLAMVLAMSSCSTEDINNDEHIQFNTTEPDPDTGVTPPPPPPPSTDSDHGDKDTDKDKG